MSKENLRERFKEIDETKDLLMQENVSDRLHEFWVAHGELRSALDGLRGGKGVDKTRCYTLMDKIGGEINDLLAHLAPIRKAK